MALVSQITEQLVKRGYEAMKSGVSVEGSGGASQHRPQMSCDQAYLATAKYCDEFLRLKQDGE